MMVAPMLVPASGHRKAAQTKPKKKTVAAGEVHAFAKPRAKTVIQPRCWSPRTRMNSHIAKGRRAIGRRVTVRVVPGKRWERLRRSDVSVVGEFLRDLSFGARSGVDGAISGSSPLDSLCFDFVLEGERPVLAPKSALPSAV